LSHKERVRLFNAVDNWAVDYPHKDWPAEIQKLRPISVYYHAANVCIVLSRETNTDRGICVMTTVSSNRPGCVREAGWSYKYLGDMEWEYEWNRKPNEQIPDQIPTYPDKSKYSGGQERIVPHPICIHPGDVLR
jgi:hypothetical protein